ncbi:Chorismate mutase [Symbiodinium microadriaticum]|uniref:chorismate mutase n=1 Tax=Symbiodinium microadriaticum TaxID=2951 RepID=A0A1Q9DS25_SYMMI|nr:Chorismate mutase [Symbiodinium microadriaticum]
MLTGLLKGFSTSDAFYQSLELPRLVIHLLKRVTFVLTHRTCKRRPGNQATVADDQPFTSAAGSRAALSCCLLPPGTPWRVGRAAELKRPGTTLQPRRYAPTGGVFDLDREAPAPEELCNFLLPCVQQAVAEAHHFCLWLHGPRGSGKSHLAWGDETRPGLADLLAHGAFRALEGLGFSEPLPEDCVLMTVQLQSLKLLAGRFNVKAVAARGGARKALTLRFLRAGKNLQLRLEGFKHQCIGACAASVFAAMSANTADLDVTNPEQALDLNNIRSVLQRMEDSIIFSLIERSQYRVNKAVYDADHPQLGAFRQHQLKAAGSNGCLGAEPVLAPVPAEAKVNQRLLELYRTKMIPSLCEEGDDGNHGSTAVQDVHVLQTMSTRIYFGLFVAESKFRSEKAKATALIEAKDAEGLTAFITKPEVEARNVKRVILKAKTFSQNIAGAQGSSDAEPATYKVNAEYIGTLFQEYIMPLTKDVEVAYLLSRLDGHKRKDPEMEIHPEWSTSPSGRKKRRISEFLKIGVQTELCGDCLLGADFDASLKTREALLGGGFVVEGVPEREVRSLGELRQLLRRGVAALRQAGAYRSGQQQTEDPEAHGLCTIRIRRAVGSTVYTSTFHLLDLVGAEATAAGTKTSRKDDRTLKSMLRLVDALAESPDYVFRDGRTAPRHIPYRDAKARQ